MMQNGLFLFGISRVILWQAQLPVPVVGSDWSGSRKWLRVLSFLIHFMTSCSKMYSPSQVHQNDTLTLRWYGTKTTHTHTHKDTHTYI